MIYTPNTIIATASMNRYAKLCDNKTNIRYATAYLRYQINRWEKKYPKISKDPGILGSVYNLPESPPHSNPKTNWFGDDVVKVYNWITHLLFE